MLLMVLGLIWNFASNLLQTLLNSNQDRHNMDETVTQQVIDFKGDEAEPCFGVSSNNIDVFSAAKGAPNGMSWIKSSNIVDYCWEERFYAGQLLAVHRNGNYIAYGLEAGKGKKQSILRVVNRETNKRCLMKDSCGMIEDLAFAYITDLIYLACVENNGTLLVYSITENDKEILHERILKVTQDEIKGKWVPFRVFWCPYIPEDASSIDDDIPKLLAVTRDKNLEMWNLNEYSSTVGVEFDLASAKSARGYLSIEAHSDFITAAVFSPDGTTIATASMDGTCKFYQVYMISGDDVSRCMHKWTPHEGKPVTNLFFLDDHFKFNSDELVWKYSVTGTKNNSELKIWTCETWECLQTIRFYNLGSPNYNVHFNVGIDLSASFIIINDMANKILYLLALELKGDGVPFISSVTELRLSYPILSFGILNVSKASLDDSDESTIIKMYIVQPKSLQSCDVVYMPPKIQAPFTNSLPVPLSPVPSIPISLPQPNPSTPPECSGGGVMNGGSGEGEEHMLNLLTPDAFISDSTNQQVEDTPKSHRERQASPTSGEVEQILNSVRHQDSALRNIEKMESEMSMLRGQVSELTKLVVQQSHHLQELARAIGPKKQKEKGGVEKINKWWSTNKDLIMNELLASVSQIVDNCVVNNINKLLKGHVNQLVQAGLKDIKEVIHTEMAKKLTATDSLLKENISKMVKSKSMVDLVSNCVANIMKPAIAQANKEALAQLSPKFDSLANTILKQWTETLTNSTANYLSEVEVTSQRYLGCVEENLSQHLGQIIEESFGRLEERLKPLRKDSAIRLSSGSLTPSVQDRQSNQLQLVSLVKEGNLTQAFQQALCASDLPLVLFLCDKVPVNQVFTSSGSILPQNILLSLIQQLSADMTHYSEVYHRYLEEAVMNLRASDPVTKEYMPTVMSGLNKQLSAFIRNNPSSPLVSRAKMLILVTQKSL